jgi:DMSO/TMAO reductase YedYZ molybdopterin-dependent catalytic subunit
MSTPMRGVGESSQQSAGESARRLAAEHAAMCRRYFLGLGAAGALALSGNGWDSVAADVPAGAEAANAPAAVLARAIAELEYLTPLDKFQMFGRGTPPPHELSPEKRRAAGLDRDTWQLEVVPDPESDCQVQRPLSKKLGTALTWDALMKLAEKHAVRLLKVMTCTNMGQPCGMGLWEGVPLREVVWLTQPKGNVRRVFYWGYHNDDPKQRFQSSLPIGRVLEDPPGESPVILCYKLNDQWLSPKAGAPVRMIVPEAYGNKSVKWLQRIVLTNNYQVNDTYAQWNNDVESPMKTYARFLHVPPRVKASQPAALTGVAQVGMSGLARVQYSLQPHDAPVPADDPYFTKADWRNAQLLPPPKRFGGGSAGVAGSGVPAGPNAAAGPNPAAPLHVDPDTGRPRAWPLRYTLVHWAALVTDLRPGRWRLRCRTIDAAGIAQPMPRPFPKSGNNAIQDVPLVVEA